MPLEGQGYSVAGLGGYFALPELSEKVRMAAAPQLRFRQFTRPIDAFGARKGDKKMFDRVGRVAAAPTTVAVAEDALLPKSKYTVTQGYVQVGEHGLTIPYTGYLELLSQLDVDDVNVKTLKQHQEETIDLLAAAAFLKSPLTYTPLAAGVGDFSTDNNALGKAALRSLAAADVKNIVNYMKKNYIPPYEGGNYVCVGSVDALQSILDDPKFIEVAQYANPQALYQGELGTFHHCRFVEAVHGLSDVIGTTAFAGECVFFGEDPVVEAVAQPEEIRHDPPTNLGRFLEIGWYGVLGFENTWDTCGLGEQRVVHVIGA